MNIDLLVEKITEKLREHQTQQVSASNSTLLKITQDQGYKLEKNTELTIDIKNKLEHVTDTLKVIEEQVKKTNGRVTVLEGKNENQSGIIRGIAIIVPILLALIVYIFNKSINELSEYGHENRQYINELRQKS